MERRASPVDVYPLTFDPVFKDYPWGGRNLESRFGRALPPGIVAESWEIAAHPNGSSTVRNGALAGKSLPEVQELWGEGLVGRNGRRALAQGRFPLLIKLLDANSWLSVQVHPDDRYALAHEGDLGKTEMWVVLHAEPGAELVYGFKAGVTRAGFAEALAAGEPERWLHRVPVVRGDVVFVPTGSIHALGPGIIVAEIQQNSDTTYRIYDWGRPRPVHIEKSLDVLNFSLVEPGVLAPDAHMQAGVRVEVIGDCSYFRTERITLGAGQQVAGQCNGTSLAIWGVLEGSVEVEWAGGSLGQDAVGWVLLPAALGDYSVRASEDAVVLRVILPDAQE
jgi:mannose-6-phosphate isomerase